LKTLREQTIERTMDSNATIVIKARSGIASHAPNVCFVDASPQWTLTWLLRHLTPDAETVGLVLHGEDETPYQGDPWKQTVDGFLSQTVNVNRVTAGGGCERIWTWTIALRSAAFCQNCTCQHCKG